jgi:hypothetical protein
MIDASVVKLTPTVGSAAACRALNTSRAGVYRRRSPRPVTAKFTVILPFYRCAVISVWIWYI